MIHQWLVLLAFFNNAQVPATAPEVVEIQLEGALSGASSLACWLTNMTHQFVRLPGKLSFAIVFVIAIEGKLTDPNVTPCPLTSPDVTVSFGTFSLLVPADTIITLTTTSGQDKAGTLDIPPDAPFPLPYSEHYDESPGQPAKARRVPHASVVCFHSPAVPR